MLRTLLCLWALLPAPSLLAHPAQEAASQTGAPLPVLVIAGANNHDWEYTAPKLQEILNASGLFRADLTTDPAADLSQPDKLGQYVAVVLDYNGPRWGEAAEANFMAAVRGGMGVSVIHAANNSFPGWEEYESLVALNWRKGTGHGRFHSFDVTIEDRDHPVTRTLPTLVAHPDELYHRLVHLHDAPYRRLAGAFSDTATGGTGNVEPMILVTQVGEGRVFHTPLGHVWRKNEASRASYADPQLHTLIVRGTEWAATGEVSDGQASANQLPADGGWTSLFDGESLAGWKAYGGKELKGWSVVNGCIVRAGGGPDIITDQLYDNFELEFEFQLAAGTNSGVKYRVDTAGMAPIGPEYQIQDDARFPDMAIEHTSASLYDVIEARGAAVAPPGLWNRARIVARGDRIEHWLNGEPVMATTVGSDIWNASLAGSKFQGRGAAFARGKGPILLQQHGGEVWFRSLRVRPLAPAARREVKLLDDGGTLDGWIETGDASYTRMGNMVTGAVEGGGQSFLRTAETYADFEFQVDVKLEVKGNSGIQFRSQLSDKGRVFGYQAEIDPSDRSWSGGIFYETERWLDDLKEDEAARAAFKLDDWNRYRILAVGPHLQVWVNGVQTANLLDRRDAEGFFAFQVHSGKQGIIHWREPRLWVIE